MCKNKSSVLAKFKPLLLLPILAVLFLIFTCNEKSRAQTLSDNQALPTFNGGEASDTEPIESTPIVVDQEPDDIQQDTVRKEREVFYIVEDMPTFNDGEPGEEFRIYISQNLQYPESAAKDSISGRVIVQFCVNYEGKVVEPVVVRSASPALDKEAIRVVSASPLWKPGKQRGKPVDVLFTFPINFVLQ